MRRRHSAAAFVTLAALALVARPAAAQESETIDQALCRMIESAATTHRMPVDFFTRLIWQESSFRPGVTSRAGAQGAAQFMPGTAAAYGLDDPFDAERSIDAQSHLMRDLLRAFGSVPLALAAYNAGPARVRACGCIPPIPETQAYVADILGLLRGAGDPGGEGAAALQIRLVR